MPFPIPPIPPKFTPLTAAAKNRQFSKKLYNDFFSFPIRQARKILETTPAEEWEKEGQKRALQVFHAAAERVPAYEDFLKKHKIRHDKVKTIDDFAHVPTIDKKKYLQAYPLEQLCWDGNIYRSHMISISSGSTGKPFLWPRDDRLELETTYLFELILDSFFHISTRKTLIVNCFAMGMYVGGPFFLNATLRTAQKGYPVTVVTPGNVMDDILRVVHESAPHYEQVILSGYPPFLKDVIENGRDAGIDWSSFRTVIFPAGEGFSEQWRDAVIKSAGNGNPLVDLLGYYGTADAAVLGMETPWSVLIRQTIADHNDLIEKIYGQNRLPSFMQYLPTLRYFEQIREELHFTTASGSIPLIRYDIGDNGGLMTHQQIMRITEKNGVDTKEKLALREYSKIWQLPYVYVFGRSDHTAILYGANIYPENIRTALETGNIANKCSGRLVMEMEEDKQHNQHLNVHVECKKRVKPTNQLREQVARTTVLVLEQINYEFANTLKAIGNKAIPRIYLHKYGDEQYFSRQRKQKWKQ